MGSCSSTTNNVDFLQSGSFRAEKPLHSNLVQDLRGSTIKDTYDSVQTMGIGSFGIVSAVKRKEDQSDDPDLYALKSLRVGRSTRAYIADLRREISIIRNLDHPNIIKAYDVFREGRNIHLVMELCTGGNLSTRQPYSEKEATKIVGKILSAIRYLHTRGIVHRDLKFNNILFENDSPNAEIKIIDFGLSIKYSAQKGPLTAQVGSFDTMAPEVIQGNYTSQADMWSIGVITNMLLANNKKPVTAANHKFNFNGKEWKNRSQKAKNFVSALLEKDPESRLTAEQAQKHPWLKSVLNKKTTSPHKCNGDIDSSDEETTRLVLSNMRAYAVDSPIKKAAHLIIAHQSFPTQIQVELRKAFDEYDSEHSGIITYPQFKDALKKSNTDFNDEELQDFFSQLDVYRDGGITYTEFLAATLECHGYLEEERIAEAFHHIDRDKTGYITQENLCHLFGKRYTVEQVQRIMQEEMDDGSTVSDQDGTISYQKFLAIFRAKK